MPNPKIKPTLEEVNRQFYQLANLDSVSHEGYIYRLDHEEHRANVEYETNLINTVRNSFRNGEISEETLEMHNDCYLHLLNKYDLIDEDGKICGVYMSNTRTYEIFYKRIIINGMVYYCDTNMGVNAFCGAYLGQLHVDENLEMTIERVDEEYLDMPDLY